MSTSLERAREQAEIMLAKLEPFCTRAVIAGSIRRGKSNVKDIEIVAEPARTTDMLGEERLMVQEIQELAATWGRRTKAGDRMIQVQGVGSHKLQVDLFLVHGFTCLCDGCNKVRGGNTWGTILTLRTGPADFSKAMVTALKGRLWKCDHGHVRDERGHYVATDTEQEFFQACRMDWMEPEHRNG